jgi:hypothetical protein
MTDTDIGNTAVKQKGGWEWRRRSDHQS